MANILKFNVNGTNYKADINNCQPAKVLGLGRPGRELSVELLPLATKTQAPTWGISRTATIIGGITLGISLGLYLYNKFDLGQYEFKCIQTSDIQAFCAEVPAGTSLANYPGTLTEYEYADTPLWRESQYGDDSRTSSDIISAVGKATEFVIGQAYRKIFG